jgi:hypothetical protein
VLAKQAPYSLSHTSSPFCAGYFRDRVVGKTQWLVTLTPLSKHQTRMLFLFRKQEGRVSWIFKVLRKN